MSVFTLETFIVLFPANGVLAMIGMAVGRGLIRREPRAAAHQRETRVSFLS